jgi:hypothetical protein
MKRCRRPSGPPAAKPCAPTRARKNRLLAKQEIAGRGAASGERSRHNRPCLQYSSMLGCLKRLPYKLAAHGNAVGSKRLGIRHFFCPQFLSSPGAVSLETGASWAFNISERDEYAFPPEHPHCRGSKRCEAEPADKENKRIAREPIGDGWGGPVYEHRSHGNRPRWET